MPWREEREGKKGERGEFFLFLFYASGEKTQPPLPSPLRHTCGATRIKPPELVLASVTFSTRFDLGSQGTRSIVTATLGMGPKKSWKAEAWMLIWFGSQVGHESYNS